MYQFILISENTLSLFQWKTSFFCCTMKEKRGSLQRLIKANVSLHKLLSLDWNKTQHVSEGTSKQMNEAVLFPADQAVWLSAVAWETKSLPSHCHHSWKPAFSERKRLNAAPPAENERLTQFHYMQYRDEMALTTTMAPPKRVPSPLLSCHCYRIRDIPDDLWLLVREEKAVPKSVSFLPLFAAQ